MFCRCWSPLRGYKEQDLDGGFVSGGLLQMCWTGHASGGRGHGGCGQPADSEEPWAPKKVKIGANGLKPNAINEAAYSQPTIKIVS